MYAFLGIRQHYNDAPDPADSTRAREIRHSKERVEINFPDDMGLAETFTSVTGASGVWANQSPLARPEWVSAQDPRLAELLGSHYGVAVRPFLPQGERNEHAGRFDAVIAGAAK